MTIKTANKSHRTALKRRVMSVPMRYLRSLGLLPDENQKLDYGCGRGFDADSLSMDKFDPFYYPQLTFLKYDIVTCNYVLNVIESEAERADVMERLKGKTRSGGVAYLTVRNDLRRLKGATPLGTWQGEIKNSEIKAHGFVLFHRTGGFRMFRYVKTPCL